MQFAVPPRRYSKRVLEWSEWDLDKYINQFLVILKHISHSDKHDKKMILLDALCMRVLQLFEYLKNNPKKFNLKTDNLFDVIYFSMERLTQEIDDMKNKNEFSKVSMKLADKNIMFIRYIQSLIQELWQKRIASIPKNKLNDDVLWLISGFSTNIKI
jgi:hypothetical protein